MPGHQTVVKAVIPAAGFGTRMLPATKTLPKEMLPVAGKPLIQYAVEEAAASGIEAVVQVPSRLGVFGRYLLEPAIWDAIAQTRPDARGEAKLTDALNLLCKERPLYGLISESQHYDAGDRLGYIRANIALSLRDPYLQQPILEYLAYLSKRAENLPQLSSNPHCTVSER